MVESRDVKHNLRNPSSRLVRRTKSGCRVKTLKLYCRCGQKLRIHFPAPKKTGKCPACGHKFALPEYGE